MVNHFTSSDKNQASKQPNKLKPQFKLDALSSQDKGKSIQLTIYCEDDASAAANKLTEIQNALSEHKDIQVNEIKTADGKEALATFVTDDGYRLRFNPETQEWSDGDLTFTNRGLNPVDDVFNELIPGSLILAAK